MAIVAGVYAAYVAWFAGDRLGLGAEFASANGRIEGVEINVAAKTAGRVTAVLLDEGEFVKACDVLARMDTALLAAQLREAQAEVRQAESAVKVAHSQVTQRESEKAGAEAVVAQREAEFDLAKKAWRGRNLSPNNLSRASRNSTTTGRPIIGQWRH